MQRRTEWCGDGNDSRESVQSKYDIPNYLQKERTPRVLSWGGNECRITRKKRGKSQQCKRERREDGKVDKVPDMGINRVFAHGLNRENQEINGKQHMEQACGCSC